jgi:flagellar hook assembly protein FlgD
VALRIYDIKGRLVKTLLQGNVAAGDRSIVWDGRDASGQKAGIGVYLCILQAGVVRVSQKLFQYR